MIDDRFKALVRDSNPWWEDGSAAAPATPEYKRRTFDELWKYAGKRQIIALIGLRRVGKTVLLNQLIKALLGGEGGAAVKPKNVFYFAFDELVARNPDALHDLLDYYFKTVAGGETKETKYVFLDEVQKVSFWQDVVKRFYDSRNDVKFFVSGSSSLQIKKSKESLAGRILDFHVPILTFREFLELNGVRVAHARNASLDFNAFGKAFDESVHKQASFEEFFLKYVSRGGFPELAREEDGGVVNNYVRSSVVEKIVLEDIPTVFEVKRKDVLAALLEYCARETANLLDVTSVAKTLGADYQTVKSYLFYLQNAFAVDLAFNYSKSTAKQLRKNKKVHVAHPCVTMALMRQPANVLAADEALAGRYVESVVFAHSKLVSDGNAFFWRSPQKEEVDVVLESKPGEVMPIEVKYRRAVDDSDAASLLKFMKLRDAKKGLVVTRGRFEEKNFHGKKVLFVPAWLFLSSI